MIKNLFLFFLCSFTSIAADPVAIYLTWQEHPESTITILWVTSRDETQNSIRFQKNNAEKWEEISSISTLLQTDTNYRVHKIELDHLEQATEYHFTLSGQSYKFRTMPAQLDQPVHFVVGGDLYPNSYDAYVKTNIEAAKTDPYFALIGGDLAYTGSCTRLVPEKMERWLEFLIAWSETMITSDGYMIPLIPCIGNHDINGFLDVREIDAESFFSFFPMPGRSGYDVLDFGRYLSIFILDTGHTQRIHGEQTNWLQDTLIERKHTLNKFALYHIPAYPCVYQYLGPLSTLIRHKWCPLFEKYGLHCAFEHHDHCYKRVQEKTVLYLGGGGWGERNPRSAKKKWYLSKTEPARHFILVTLHPNGKRCYSAIDDNGKVFDYVEN